MKEELDSLLKIARSFQNTNLDSQLEQSKKITKKHLINILNYVNFQDSTILVNLQHLKFGNIISLPAKPRPCLGDTLDCIWVQKTGPHQKLSSYKFLNFLLADGQKLLLVRADVKEMSEEGISFILPETCYEVGTRKVRRHLCEGIQVELIQNSVVFYGSLLDFSTASFSIEVSAAPPQTFQWINPEFTVHVIFKNEQDILYSGECKIVRQTLDQKMRTFVLEPLNDNIRRFKPKEFRSSRHKLLPSPNIIFKHPLTGRLINLKVEDLSGSGFSVEEYYEDSVFLPGMIIPELYIEIANNFKICCKAQVVYRNVNKTYVDEPLAKYGIAILDMDIQDQVKLSSLLHQATNEKSYVCNIVDLDALWNCFFKAGTIYPQRYAFIHANKEKFKKTYEKLYIQSPTISRHFIYQDKGIIHGHISMLRFYENTWLIHQLASGAVYSRSGLVVLDQLGRYVNSFRYIYSAHMDFLICYFRPTTKFSNRIFGGFAKELNKPKGCSIDSFAFFRFSTRAFEQQDFSGSWTLTKTQPEDLLELESFYEYASGGLMLNALDLEPDMIDSDALNKEYQRLGFKRERHLFSLKKDGDIKAIIVVTVADIGLDMSNLTSCIHVIVLDSNELPLNIINSQLSKLSHYYEQDEIPVLLYPLSYAESQSMPYEKLYNLWSLNISMAGDRYLQFMDHLLTHAKYD
ncbi:MAG: hypothetical protein WA126_12160 [Thermodesulfovibrionales bacterium]